MDNQDEIWQTAFADVERSQENLDFVEKLMTSNYNIEEYLIGSETEPRHHFHIVAKTTKKAFKCLLKKLATDFNLFTHTKGGLRKYGVDKKRVMDLTQCLIYCTKQSEGDTDNLRASYDEDELIAYFNKSYIVTAKKKIYEEVHEYLEELHEKTSPSTISVDSITGNNIDIKLSILKQLKMDIIGYLRVNTTINISRSNVMLYLQHHIKHTIRYNDIQKDELIYTMFF
ncbi:MAG: putative replicase [Circoviridae sp.]|nr:MAG: putative replicase [Circoviridae sp.]